MKPLITPILKFIGLLILVAIIAVAPELLGPVIGNDLKEVLGDNYKVVVLCVSIIALLIYTYWSEGGHFFKSKKEQNTPKNPLAENLPKIRKGLLESYTERISSKLGKRFPINVELKYSLEGTNTKAPLYDNYTFRQSKIKEELISIFDKHKGRLLIIGEPGAGKTTLTLQLAIELIEREGNVIPIVINIATWRERFKSVEDWFLELLPQMGFSKSLVELLLKENCILPLFDGLDELVEEKRKPCLEAIGEYGVANNVRYVICSRIVEYSQTVDAPVKSQIAIRPLTLDQIKKQLKELGTPESNGMLDAINKDELLAEAIQTPFYLNTTQLLFANSRTWVDLNFNATEIEGRKLELVEIFLKEKLSSISFPFEQSQKWASFFAYEMNKHHLVKFELLDLQYTWSKWSSKQLRFGKMAEGLVVGLAMSISVGLVMSLILGLTYSAAISLVIGLAISLAGGLTGGLNGGLIRDRDITNPIIDVKDMRVWSLSIFIQKFKNYFKPIMFMGIAFYLFGGLFLGMFGNLFEGLIPSIFGGLILSIFGGITVGLFGGLFFGMIEGLREILMYSTVNFIKINHPYQRFRASFQSLYFSILQHWILCYQLDKKGLLPNSRKLVAFLDELSQNHVMEKSGGSWRFRHRIIQDHFAAIWDAEKEELKE